MDQDQVRNYYVFYLRLFFVRAGWLSSLQRFESLFLAFKAVDRRTKQLRHFIRQQLKVVDPWVHLGVECAVRREQNSLVEHSRVWWWRRRFRSRPFQS